MSRNSLFSTLNAFMSFQRRTEEEDYARAARLKAEQLEAHMAKARPSGRLGNGRLARLDDADAAGLFDTGGLFLGALDGRFLFYNGDGSLLTYIRAGGGKSRDLINCNLAHIKNQSVVVVDVKDAESCYVSHDHRKDTLNTTVVYLNPCNLLGLGNTRFSLLSQLERLRDEDTPVDDEADQIAHLLLPANPKAGENAWVRDGAVRYIALVLEYLTITKDTLTLSNVWRFFNAGDDALEMKFDFMASCGHEGIEGRAKAFKAMWSTSPKQHEAIRSECIGALHLYEPMKTLARSTDGNDFDFRRLKHENCTVYIMLPSSKLDVYSKWLTLVIHALIETVAAETGPIRTTFFIDEFPQIYPTESINKALYLYRARGIQLWMFAQGRYALENRWGKEAVKGFEDGCAVLILKNIHDREILKDAEMWAGNTTLLTYGKNLGGGTVEHAGENFGETKRSVLQSEDLLGLGDKLYVKIATQPHPFILDAVPYFNVNPWKNQILDVRGLHTGAGFSATPPQL